MAYRNTPHSTTGVSLTELFLRRKPRTWLDVMKPSTGDQTGGTEKQSRQRACRKREFKVGETVWVGPKWVPGEICNRNGPVSYEVNVSGQVWRHHAEQMLTRSGPYHDTLPQSEVVGVGEEVSEPDNLPARPAISSQDIAVAI